MNVRAAIEDMFKAALVNAEAEPPAEFRDDMVLLESGLDSLGFAILVARLEERLGYDPFSLMEEPIYPQTFGDFVSVYEKYEDLAKS